MGRIVSGAFSTAASSKKISPAVMPCIYADRVFPSLTCCAGKWKQTWVDNEGGYLDFVGESKDGQMILSREATRPDGTKGLSTHGI